MFDRSSTVYAFGEVGPGIPFGLVGGGIGIAPIPQLALEMGGGGGTSGPQAAAMLNGRIRVSHYATLGLSTGVSAGPALDHEPDLDSAFEESPPRYVKRWPWAFWSNTEVQLRLSYSEHIAMRYHFGVAIPFAMTKPVCEANDRIGAMACMSDRPPTLAPYLGFSLEYAP
jgi:hypothetical protein